MVAILAMYKSQKVRDSILGNGAIPKDRAQKLILFKRSRLRLVVALLVPK